MNETKLRTIAQLQDFLKTTPQVSFSGVDEKDDNERYAHISRVLKRFDYPQRKKHERGVVLAYVLYVEGGTDVDMLRALADRLQHPAAPVWDERINTFYVQNNYPDISLQSELERVEGGFCVTPRVHFNGLQGLLPEIKGLAVLDNDGMNRQGSVDGRLTIAYWRRYEAENYFVTPDVLRRYALGVDVVPQLFDASALEVDEVLDTLVLERVFESIESDFHAWKQASSEAARLVWEAKTQRLKLSTFAEEFFRRLAASVGDSMLLTKGELHRLISVVDPKGIPAEVSEKLDLLFSLFTVAAPLAEVDQT